MIQIGNVTYQLVPACIFPFSYYLLLPQYRILEQSILEIPFWANSFLVVQVLAVAIHSLGKHPSSVCCNP